MEIHFLNVGEGDCSIIEHDSGRISMIDICCGNIKEEQQIVKEAKRTCFAIDEEVKIRGDFKQRLYPVNPINWLGAELNRDKNLKFFRFIATHPHMDHLDGIKKLFAMYKPRVFWDTKNDIETVKDTSSGYSDDDWAYYQKLHTTQKEINGIQILRLSAGVQNRYYNQDDDKGDGDRIAILSPSEEIIETATNNRKVNDLSYVLLIKDSLGHKFLFASDSEKAAWDIMLEKYKDELKNVDVLFAPHHGRKSGGNEDYLDTLNPKLTLFGNANSDCLDDDKFNYEGLRKFSNNQLGSVVITKEDGHSYVWATNKSFVDKWKAANQRSSNSVTRKRGGHTLYWLMEIS